MRLSELAAYIKRGITPKYTESGICVLNQKCIRNNQIDYGFARKTSTDKTYDNEKFLISGDILINSTGAGTLGRIAYFPGNSEPVLVDSHVTILRVKEDYPSIVLAYYLFSVEAYIGTLGKGSTNQLELGRDALLRLDIPDLSNDELKSYEEVFTGLNSLIRNYKSQIAMLEEMALRTCAECFQSSNV